MCSRLQRAAAQLTPSAQRGGAHVGVGDRHRQRVGGVGLQLALQVQHHAAPCAGPAPSPRAPLPTSDCLISSARTRAPAGRRRTTAPAPRRAPGRASARKSRIGHEHRLDRDLVRAATASSSASRPSHSSAQARAGNRPASSSFERLRMHDSVQRPSAVDVDDADAGALRAGVDSEDVGSRRQPTPIRRRRPRRGRRWSRRSGRRPCPPASAAA